MDRRVSHVNARNDSPRKTHEGSASDWGSDGSGNGWSEHCAECAGVVVVVIGTVDGYEKL